jgi:hypothetical protein
MLQRLLIGLAVVGLLAGVAAFSRSDKPSKELALEAEDRNPWTGGSFNNAREEFQFAIVSDRTGSHRAQVFSRAMDRLNLLQPEFVLSIGDLIEGGKKTEKQLADEWEEFDSYVQRLGMPFFYVPGNHDVGNEATAKFWTNRWGRRYYHFLYHNVLFLCLNTDDPPGSGTGRIAAEQRDWALGVLKANRGVRWTIVALHKPIWTSATLEKSGWLEVEKALADRPYTVFCGHVHRYQKFVRQGRNYYQLATTGGGSKMRGVSYGEFDHVVWVTMKKEGPRLANLLLDSILPDDLRVPESKEQGTVWKVPPLHPVRGTVLLNGVPVVGGYVLFLDEKLSLSRRIRADGYTEADGSFQLSTLNAFDGIPEGTYLVTVVQRKPLVDSQGKPGPNALPERYAAEATTPLKMVIKPGVNEVVLELKR